MTCKDCLHYEAHKHFFKSDDYEKDFDDYFKDKNIECKCPEFTDRSEWVHLPCKINAELYFIQNNTTACQNCGEFDKYDSYCYFVNQSYPEIAQTPICDKQFMEIEKRTANLITIAENIDKIGKTVFPTRKEAEKALKERGEND